MTKSTRGVVLASFVLFVVMSSGCGQQVEESGLGADELASSQKPLGQTPRDSNPSEPPDATAAIAAQPEPQRRSTDVSRAPCSCNTFGRTSSPCPAQPKASDVGTWCGGGVTRGCPQVAVCSSNTCEFEAYNIQERIAAGVPRYEAVLISKQIGWCQ
ncbi:MAG: hypothetical protein Q8S33_36930 [Myxococcales bacterium]|nr:hypothetical protein [Myxococcales bacterium]